MAAKERFWPDARGVRLYALWAGVTGVAFFAIYPTLNWLTSLRPHRFRLYLGPELAIPFVPQFIWAYFSMYLLFLLPLFLLPSDRMSALGKQLVAGTVASGVMFLLLPAELGFARVIPSDPILASLYRSLFGVDQPHNLVPSLHVVWSSAIALACIDPAGSLGRALLGVWLALLVGSTVLVHQHHILDVISAMLLVLFLRRRYGVPNAQILAGRRAPDRRPDLRCGRA
jgi:membrane-associated phospholipid phosphatase